MSQNAKTHASFLWFKLDSKIFGFRLSTTSLVSSHSNYSIYWTDWQRQAVLTADKNSGLRLRVVKSDLIGVMDLKVLHSNAQTGHNGCLSRNLPSCPGLCVGMPSGSAASHSHHHHPVHFQLTNNRTCLCPNGLKRERSHDSFGNERCACPEDDQIFANGTCMFKNDTCDASSQFQCQSHTTR